MNFWLTGLMLVLGSCLCLDCLFVLLCVLGLSSGVALIACGVDFLLWDLGFHVCFCFMLFG